LGWVKDTADSVKEFFHSARTVAANVPWVADKFARARQTFLSPVIRRITGRRDPDLQAALDLYEKRIPDSQRFDSSDIIRWITESKQTDCFLVAKHNGKVCGVGLFHYYENKGLGLFAYLVVAKKIGLSGEQVSDRMMRKILRFIGRTKGPQVFLIEVEDPRRQSSREKKMESLARIRIFRRLATIGDFSLRAVDISYQQPPLNHLPEDLEQENLLLLYATRDPARSQLPRVELARILDFIYLELYPDGYSENPDESRSYVEKCRRARDVVNRALPEEARLIGFAELKHEVLG
jgi:hypothetical protein